MSGSPTTPKQYLDALPPDRRKAMSTLRAEINRRLPKGYKEGMQYGMIAWFVPHALYPEGYHCDPKQPLPFASIASQKNHIGLYLFCIYTDAKETARFQKEWKKTGKRLDMGKSCVRFKSLDDVPLSLVGDTVARIPVTAFIEAYEAMLPASVKKKRAAKKKAATKKAAKKKAAKKKGAKKKAAKKKAAGKRAGARR